MTKSNHLPMIQLFSELQSLCEDLLRKQDLISEKRKEELLHLANDISHMLKKHSFANVISICTHNSRRSQASQLWIKTAALYFGHENIYSFSGGTEATAFNHRMVSALERTGFLIEHLDHFPNPKYHIPLSEDDHSYTNYYSKVYSESYNPQQVFIAVLLCGSAHESCPIVTGATGRHYIPYIDPGESDGQKNEGETYYQKVFEIGREMVYMMSKVKA